MRCTSVPRSDSGPSLCTSPTLNCLRWEECENADENASTSNSAFSFQCTLSCATAEETWQTLDEQRKDMTRQLRLARQKERRMQRQQVGAVLPKCLRAVLLLLYVFGGYTPDIAQSDWNLQRQRKKLGALAHEDSKRRVENIFLQCEHDELESLLDRSNHASRIPLRRASYWANKMKLAGWVRACKLQQGLAPSNRLLVCKWNAIRRATPFLWKADDHLCPSIHSGSRVLLWRWRRAVRGRWKPIRI